MKYFPFFMELSKQSVLIVGGGEVAERKLDLLIKANANVTLISPEFTENINNISKQKKFKCIIDKYSDKYLDKNDYAFVIVATNNEKLNEKIANDAKQKKN